MQVVNPNTKKTVEIDGAKFQVGILPYGKRLELEALAYQSSEGSRTVEDIKAMLHQAYEFVRWGIKGHDNVTMDGAPVAFDAIEHSMQGVVHRIVSDNLMAIYAATPGLLVKLSKAVTEFNYLQAEEKKG